MKGGPTEILETKTATMSSCPSRTPWKLLEEQIDNLPNCGPLNGLVFSREDLQRQLQNSEGNYNSIPSQNIYQG